MNNDSLAGYFQKKLMKLRHKEELRKSATNYFRNLLSKVIQKRTLDSNLRATGQMETQPSTLKPPSQMRAPTAPKAPEAPKVPKVPKTPTQNAANNRSNQIAPAKPNKPKGPIGPKGPLEPIPPEPARKQQYRRLS